MPFTFTSNGKGSTCGHESFISSHHPADYAPVTCLGCGHVTTVAAARAASAFAADVQSRGRIGGPAGLPGDW